MKIEVLDHGYVELIETWGSDERFVEAARMSTNKGFKGWKTDQKLLNFLYRNNHATPFEMGGLIIEVKAPIMVFREWHRHRTQSYNEMSGRYIPMPNENYTPTRDRVIEGSKNKSNKQATGIRELDPLALDQWLTSLNQFYQQAEDIYSEGLEIGVPKELARLSVPVARYSRMRASANVRNWLAFLTLRQAPGAQWEIRQYAHAVGDMIAEHFPRTWALFMEEGSH